MTRLIFHLNGGVLNLIVIHQVVLDLIQQGIVIVWRDHLHMQRHHLARLPSIHVHGAHCGLPGFPGIRRFSSAISSDTGAPSSNSFTLSFNSRHALRRTRSDTSIERMGSAGAQLVQIIINAAIIAPTEPSRSPSTCSAAARTLRFFSSLP